MPIKLFSNFLEEISTLSQSTVFLYFFALIIEEGFLISPCCSLELCVQMGISFLFSLAFSFPFFFTAICKASSDSPTTSESGTSTSPILQRSNQIFTG